MYISYFVILTGLHSFICILYRYGVSDDECAGYIGIVSLKGTEAGEKCAIMNQFPCGETRKMSKYRNFDGSCNNVKRPSLGRAMTGFKRLLHPKYGDGIEQVIN